MSASVHGRWEAFHAVWVACSMECLQDEWYLKAFCSKTYNSAPSGKKLKMVFFKVKLKWKLRSTVGQSRLGLRA